MGSKKKDEPKTTLEVGKGQLLRVKASRDGYRRAGVAHSKSGTDHPATAFSAEQIAVLQADPNLSVSVVDAPKGGAPE